MFDSKKIKIIESKPDHSKVNIFENRKVDPIKISIKIKDQFNKD